MEHGKNTRKGMKICKGTFKIKRLIGKGASAYVYEGKNLKTYEKVAIKVGHTKKKETVDLKEEAKKIKALNVANGFPTLHWVGPGLGPPNPK